MKKYFIIFCLILIKCNLLGQISSNIPLKTKDTIPSDSLSQIEEKPKLVGGVYSLTQNIKYPKEAIENNIEGRILLTCTVTAKGKVENIKIIRGLGFGCDEEAIRLVSEAEWEPGKIENKNAGMEVLIPLKFKIK